MRHTLISTAATAALALGSLDWNVADDPDGTKERLLDVSTY